MIIRMNMVRGAKIADWLESVVDTTRRLFSLRMDTDEPGTIEYVRANVEFKSANAWTLIFAIVVASVGLNTNSSAVIIGAMLISPLMGPIVGAGLGLGINDFPLIRRALRNLAFAVTISVLASTVYFLISPLSEVQSELLARTRPTFFDVIIAVFGGAAGIVALSRQEKSNAIPGVAIATALMPPLCTAGFGLANGEWKYFFGALYLFIINSVFICISTFIFVRYLRFQKISRASELNRRQIDRWVFAVGTIVIIPSLVLAWQLQLEMSFRAKADTFINAEMKFDHSFIVGKTIEYNWSHPKIIVNLIGESLGKDQMSHLKERMPLYSLDPKILVIKESSLAESIERKVSDKLNSQNQAAKQTEIKLAHAELDLQRFKSRMILSGNISRELKPLFSKIENVYIEEIMEKEPSSAGAGSPEKVNVIVQWKSRPSKKEYLQVSEFLKQRIDSPKEIEHVLKL